jgi:hypothetical protein
MRGVENARISKGGECGMSLAVERSPRRAALRSTCASADVSEGENMYKTIQTWLAVGLLAGATGCGAADGAAEGGEENIESASQAIVGNRGLGSWANGTFYLDINGNGTFDNQDAVRSNFGKGQDIPVMGYGRDLACNRPEGPFAVFRPSTAEFLVDKDGDIKWVAGVDTLVKTFSGFANQGYALLPFTWKRKVGATCRGSLGLAVQINPGLSSWIWFADLDDDGGIDTLGEYGDKNQWPAPMWSPARNSTVMATFNRDNGAWYVDSNGDRKYTAADTPPTNFGQGGDFPITHSGSTIRGVTRFNDKRYIDGNGSGWWEGPPADNGYAFRQTDLWAFFWF